MLNYKELEKEFEEFENERGFTQNFEENIIPSTVSAERNLKTFNHFTEVTMKIAKRFKKLCNPPFNGHIESDFVYDKKDFEFIMEYANNPYLRSRDVKEFTEDGLFAKELYVSEI